MLSGPSFRSAFVFSINSLILSGFSLTFFHLAEASLFAFSWLYTECAVVQKYHGMSFIYNHSHLQYSFCNQLVLFAQDENVNKLWDNNRIVHLNERNQKKNKAKSRHIQIDHALGCLIQATNSVMVSLKDGFTVWRQSQKERLLSLIY